ncbi:MAG: 4Fe-4S binding protein, partial [Treponema sp.]|nr:4Fe-4S binding protein [Treponema sp.]
APDRYPSVLKEKCTSCGVCRDSCPQKAITIDMQGNKPKPAEIDIKRCIRCYCCHELCPSGAVEVRKT